MKVSVTAAKEIILFGRIAPGEPLLFIDPIDFGPIIGPKPTVHETII